MNIMGYRPDLSGFTTMGIREWAMNTCRIYDTYVPKEIEGLSLKG
jgi:hypothetical protein